MDKDRLERIEEIYQAAADKPPGERPSYLTEACGTDAELRREVESLLRYDANDPNFIDSSPAHLAAEIFSDVDEGPRLIGETLAHYTIERLLGKGGMGEVYLAEDTRLHRRVALKVLSKSVVGDSERLARFEREAQAASALNHPNILTVHEFGESKGIHYIASELIDGLTLRQRLIAGRLELAEVLDLAVQTASALSAAHEAGITHRDIKPENIMVRRDGYVKVLDFGLAKLAQTDSPSSNSGSEDATVVQHKTKPGAVMGTAAYMSPEQARGKYVDARTDIWSLGAVVYEMLAGTKPFSGDTTADIIVSVLSSEPVPLSQQAAGLPPELEWIVSKALSKNIDARYQTAKELRADLEKIRKRIEFEENLSRSSGASLDGKEDLSKAHSTADALSPATEGGERPTNPGDAGATSDRDERHTSSIETVVGYARTHRYRTAITAVVILTLFSSAVYLSVLAPAASAQIDSIAVLPLENLSGNPDLDYAADGLSESLIDRLSQLPQLKVISRRSSFQFRGANIDPREVSAKLGARAILTGSISQVGDELSVRVDVVDAAEDRHLTGGQFLRKKSDLPNLQNEIARTAVEKLQLKLTDSQTRRLAETVTEDSDAYRYYLSGLVELNGPLGVGSRALEYFEHAVKLDPEFAAAYAEIAWVYWAQANADADPNELMPKAKAAAERALSINPELAKGHAVRAMVHEYEFDWAGAENQYLRAIELSPNLDFARNNYAFFLSVLGRQNEALAQLEEQRTRDPLNQRLLLLQKAIVLIQARRFDDALEVYRDAQALDPSKEVPPFILGYAYAGKGLDTEAVAYYKKAIEGLGGEEKYSQPLVYLAAVYAKSQRDREEARRILARIEGMGEYKSPALLAIIYSALDDNSKAMALLEQAYIKRDLLLRYIGTAYEYDGLRQDPRFIDLLKRTGLAVEPE